MHRQLKPTALVMIILFMRIEFLIGQPLKNYKHDFSFLPDRPNPMETNRSEGKIFKKAQSDSNVTLIGCWAGGPFFAVAVDSVRNLAFLGSDGYMEIVDISNKGNPKELSKITLPSLISDISVIDTLVYAADWIYGLRIIGVSDPTHPQEIGYCETDGNSVGLFVKDSCIYMAAIRGGLRIIDISDATEPKEVGFYNNNYDAWGVFVVDDYAYVANGLKGLSVIDISNFSALKEVGYYHTGGYAKDVIVKENYAYIADYSHGLRIIDVSNPAAPSKVGFYDSAGEAISVAIKGTYIYLANGYSGLRIIDVNNPMQPHEVGYYDTDGNSKDLYLCGSYVYVADREDGLYILQYTGETGLQNEEIGAEKHFALHQNYPNPFNPTTTIKYALPKAANVKLEVFNVLGQKVAVLFEGHQAAGYHQAVFNGVTLSGGVYYYRLTTDAGFSQTKKMILIR